jgi:transcription initiation factor IIF auxiliary subunit
LNFQQEKYEVTHTVVFKNPSQALQERLRETGPLPSDEDRPKKKGLVSKKGAQKYDYEKIAEALEKLEEEDLLRVIQLINENKGPETYIRSDVEGESKPHAPQKDAQHACIFFPILNISLLLLWTSPHPVLMRFFRNCSE